MVFYHVYSPVELLLVSFYFNESVLMLKKRNWGLLIGLSGIVAAIINAFIFQPVTTINFNFLLLEGTIISVFCLLSFHQIVLDEKFIVTALTQFWVTSLLLIYWCLTYTGWGVFMLAEHDQSILRQTFHKILVGSNLLFYMGFVSIFLFYKKLIPSGK